MRPRKKPNLVPRLSRCASVIFPVPMDPKEIPALKGHIRGAFPTPSAPLHLEIGCGKGQFVCELASRNPGVNFLALEREENVAVVAAERAMELGLQNVRFLLCDAELLPQLIEKGELMQIYINFCDPWHKHRQFKRRLTYRARLELYKTLLADGGELWFKTDNYNLFHFSTFEFEAAMPPYFITRDLHHSEYAADNIITEYEAYFSGLGQPIYAIRAKKPAERS